MKKRILWIFVVFFLTGTAFSESAGLTIHFIDVGQADATVLLCDGEVMMIDGGNVADSSLIYTYLTKTLGLRYIDYMIATHPHEDHIGGLSAALNSCTVGMIFTPITEYDNNVYADLQKYADLQSTPMIVPAVGECFSFGSAEVQFLSPCREYADINDLSLVVRVDYGENSFLFAGDAGWETEHDMIESGLSLSADVLKVGHHGSDTASSYVFIREVMPEYAVISVGSDNPYGHPSEVVISRLQDAGTTVYRTDQCGTIICQSNGKDICFATE